VRVEVAEYLEVHGAPLGPDVGAHFDDLPCVPSAGVRAVLAFGPPLLLPVSPTQAEG
jgi:hypothetical protein